MWKYRKHLLPWIKQLWMFSRIRDKILKIIRGYGGYTGTDRTLSPMSFPDYLVYHGITKKYRGVA